MTTPARRRWERGRWVLLALTLLLLGTSRPLRSKELVAADVEIPGGIAAVSPARAVLGENIDNQGCCSRQWADLAFHVELRNEGSAPAHLDQQEAAVVVDGVPYRMSQITWTVGDERNVLPFEAYAIEPGGTARLRLLLTAFLPASAVRSVQTIEVQWPTETGTLVFRFEDVAAVSATTATMRPSLWY